MCNTVSQPSGVPSEAVHRGFNHGQKSAAGDNFACLGWEWHMDWTKRILVYGLPALSIPLADPMMTAVDTLFVGQACSTSQLAALGPSGTIFSVMQFAFGFLGVATIKRITVAVAAGEEAQVGNLMQPALLLAAIVGLALVTTTYAIADQLLMLVATPQGIHGAAKTYLSIRILSQPAVILCAVAQSGLLAMKDPVSPLWAVVVMCVVNCVGDALMVGHLHLGLAGVAWATVAAQYSALAVLLWCWARRPGSQSPFAAARFPTVAEFRSMSADFGVLWGISSVRTLCYSSVRVAAAALGTVPCAAYTALYSVWMPLSFVAMPLRSAAMVFLPPFLTRPDPATKGANEAHTPPQKWATLNAEGTEVVKILMALGLCFGAVAGLLIAILAVKLPWIFSSDAAVVPMIYATALPAFVALTVSGVMEISEGILLVGTKSDNEFLLKSMVFTIVLVNCALQLSHHAGWGLVGVWWSLVSFYLLRMVQPTIHIMANTLRRQS